MTPGPLHATAPVILAGPAPPGAGGSSPLSLESAGGRVSRASVALALALIALLGFARGARVAVGGDGLAPPQPPPATVLRTHDPLGGSLWVPVGSTVTERALDARPVLWVPLGSALPAGSPLQPGTTRAGRLRLAALGR